jgi:hypothetical protein
VIGGVARRRDRGEGPDARTLGEPDVDRPLPAASGTPYLPATVRAASEWSW